MNVNPRLLGELRNALAAIAPPDRLTIVAAELFSGPSPHSKRPSLLVKVAVGADERVPPDLQQRVAARFSRFPVIGDEGQPSPATSAASLAAAVLTELIGIEHECGKTPDGFWIDYVAALPALSAAGFALAAAAEAAWDLAPDGSAHLLASLQRRAIAHRPNRESLLLLKAARIRNLPVLPVADDAALWQVGWGERGQIFWEMATNGDGIQGYRLSHDKNKAKRLFAELGIPTPVWRAVGVDGDIIAAAAAVGWPCVVKPLDRGGGHGVTADIRTVEVLEQAVARARALSPVILIEAFQPGDDHRLTVIEGQLVAVTRRRPATVTGDGKSSVAALIDALNRSRSKGGSDAGFLKQVPRDEGTNTALAGQGLTLDSVPAEGLSVRLRTNANHSTGGTLADLTHRIHPETRALAERIALAFGLRVAGLDYISPDIGKSHAEAGGAFIEINATPGIRGIGAAGIDEVALTASILDDRLGRIPAILLLAPSEQHDALVEALGSLMTSESECGLASLKAAQIGGLALPASPPGPRALATSLLRYPTLRSLLIVWDIETLCDHGLPVDRLECAIILDADPPPAWLAVIERSAGAIVAVDNAAAAAAQAANCLAMSRP